MSIKKKYTMFLSGRLYVYQTDVLTQIHLYITAEYKAFQGIQHISKVELESKM